MLTLLITALKNAGVSEISEKPVDGWICAYCGVLNKDVVCAGCGAQSPVPIEESAATESDYYLPEPVHPMVESFKEKVEHEVGNYPYGTVYPANTNPTCYCYNCSHRGHWWHGDDWCKKLKENVYRFRHSCEHFERKA